MFVDRALHTNRGYNAVLVGVVVGVLSFQLYGAMVGPSAADAAKKGQ